MPDPPNVSPVRGMRDLLPAECELRDWAVARILDTYRRFGFARIETPVLEHLPLLAGGQGGENEKLIFKVLNRGEALSVQWVDVFLRFEALRASGVDKALADRLQAGQRFLHWALREWEDSGASGATVVDYLLHKSAATGHLREDPEGRDLLRRTIEAYQDYREWLVCSMPKPILAGEKFSESGLRFDLTVPLARYYAANQSVLPQPFKAIQIGPVFRAERPQKGRFRQFTQCDIDVIGEPGETAEVELMLATTEALAALGLSGFTIRLNDRGLLEAFARQAQVADDRYQEFLVVLDKLDKIGVNGVEAELTKAGFPTRTTDLTVSFLSAHQANAASSQADAAITHAADVLERERGERIASIIRSVQPGVGDKATLAFDPTLVRGMGYYTGPIFEISMAGAPGSIAGGGRYDRMIGRLLGREVPACGFSIGFERVIGLLGERGVRAPKAGTRYALLYEPGVDPLQRVMAEAAARRGAVEGNSVAVFARRKKAGKQLDELEKAGFDCVLTLPEGNGPPEEKWLGGGASR